MKNLNLENDPKITSGFITPEGYFEDFSERMMQQLPDNETKVISIFSSRKTWIIAVAAVLAIGLMFPVANSFLSKPKELDDTAIENYLTYQSDLNQDDLIGELENIDFNKIKPYTDLENNTIEDILSKDSDTENLLTE
jgi:hypothetical protein